MKANIFLILLFFVSFFLECKKCGILNQSYKTSLENKSNSDIKIDFYFEGKKNEESISLKKNEKINNTIFMCDGKLGSPNLFPRVIFTNGGTDTYSSKFPIDSIILNFGDLKTKNHIAFNRASKNKDALNINDSRNIFNYESYKVINLANIQCEIDIEAIYTINELDFENAKK